MGLRSEERRRIPHVRLSAAASSPRRRPPLPQGFPAEADGLPPKTLAQGQTLGNRPERSAGVAQ